MATTALPKASMRARMLALTLLVAATSASPAQAADNGFYLGAGVANSDFGIENPGSLAPFDDEDQGFKLIAGFRPLDNLGVEINYADHGDASVPGSLACAPLPAAPCASRVDLSAKTLAAFAVGFIDFPFVDLFGKIGAASWKVDAKTATPSLGFSTQQDDIDLAWGGGVQARLGSLGARLEYEQFKIGDDEDLSAITLAVTWTFL
jgi:opacity protein-like surface antigen